MAEAIEEEMMIIGDFSDRNADLMEAIQRGRACPRCGIRTMRLRCLARETLEEYAKAVRVLIYEEQSNEQVYRSACIKMESDCPARRENAEKHRLYLRFAWIGPRY